MSQSQHLEYFEEHESPNLSHLIEHDSGVEGPNLLFGTGIHGDEAGGVEAAIEMHKALIEGRVSIIRGKISFLLGNPDAYREGLRFLDENLNRLFTSLALMGKLQNDTIEGRRAVEILGYIKKVQNQLRAIVDLHSVSSGDFNMVVVNRGKSGHEVLVDSLPKLFQYQFAYIKEHLRGIFSEVADMIKAEGFSIECGNHGLAKDRALLYMQATSNYYEMGMEGDLPTDRSQEELRPEGEIIRYQTIEAIRPTPGFRFIREDISTGHELQEGEVYAQSNTKKYKAPQDCVVVMPTRDPKPNDVDVGFLCTVAA